MTDQKVFALTGTVAINPGNRPVRVGVNLQAVFIDTGEGWACIPWHRVAAIAALDPEAQNGPGAGMNLNDAVARAEAAQLGQGVLPGMGASEPVAGAPASEPTEAPTAPLATPGEAPKRRQRCKACGELKAAKRNTVCADCTANGVDARAVGAKVGKLSEALGAKAA